MKPLNLSKPHLIVMVGIPGSGKSFFAEHFASTFSAPYVNIETIAKELSYEDSPSEEHQAAIGRISAYLLEQLYKTGQTIIYEGMTDARSTRTALAKMARDKGYEPLLVWVQTESVAAKTRATKPKRGQSYLNSQQFDSAIRQFTPPNAAERAIVISGKHTYPSQLKIVLKRLAEGRSEQTNAHIPGRRTIEGRHITVR